MTIGRICRITISAAEKDNFFVDTLRVENARETDYHNENQHKIAFGFELNLYLSCQNDRVKYFKIFNVKYRPQVIDTALDGPNPTRSQ